MTSSAAHTDAEPERQVRIRVAHHRRHAASAHHCGAFAVVITRRHRDTVEPDPRRSATDRERRPTRRNGALYPRRTIVRVGSAPSRSVIDSVVITGPSEQRSVDIPRSAGPTSYP
jgi:hypothetical protein